MRRWCASSTRGRVGVVSAAWTAAFLVIALAAGAMGVSARAADPGASGASAPSPVTAGALPSELPLADLVAVPPTSPPYRVGDTIVLKPGNEIAGAQRLFFAGESKALTAAGWAAHFPVRPEVKLVPIQPGQLAVPEFGIADVNGRPVGRTRPVTIEIGSAIASDDPAPTQPADAPPPVALELPWQYSLAVIVLVLGLIAGIAFLIIRWKRRPARVPATVVAAPMLEHEVALAALDALAREGWLSEGRHKRHAFAISEILKTYVGARYGFDALESTSSELIDQLESLGIEARTLDRWESLFQRLDRVKFTDFVPEAGAGEALGNEAKQLVLDTKRRPIAPQMPSTESGRSSGREADHAVR